MDLRALRSRLVTADRLALLFAATVVVLAAASSDDAPSDDPRDFDGWALLIFGVALTLNLLSRRFPAGVALAVLGLTFLWYGAGYTNGLVNVATLLAYYQLGRSEGQRRKVLASAVSVAALLLNVTLFADEPLSSALTAAGYVLVAVVFGELVRSRGLLVEHYARRAEEAEAEAERRITEERLRIARDLHDVLAHTVAAMTVQAGVASDRMDRDPEAAKEALRAIREAGRRAMGEVQTTVSVLRSGSADGQDPDVAGLGPAPGLDRLQSLFDAVSEQGVRVEVDVSLADRPLPEVVQLTVFRVVQEALTNVVRHAHATTARVVVREDPDGLTVEVRDDGRGGAGPAKPGFGLRGMAERVESVGGRLWHGRNGDGGWVVRASLPHRREPA